MKSTIDHALYDPNQPLYKKFSAIQTQFDVTLGKIRALCSDSDIETLVNGDTTMYNRLANVELTATGLISDVSRVEAKYDAQSGQITELQSDLSEFIQDEAGFRTTVSSTYYTTNSAKIDKETIQQDITDISDNLDQNYSTTVEMESAIEESARQIRLGVSQTYATQQSVTELETSKSANYTGDYTPTNSNAPANEWSDDDTKRKHINDIFMTNDGKAYQYVQGRNGCWIKFNEKSELSPYVGNIVRIYYQLNGKTYVLPSLSRTALSGAIIFVPSNIFWVYLNAGSNSNRKWGFGVDSVSWGFGAIPNNATETSLPSGTATEVSGDTYPESEHPYASDTPVLWKYTSSNSEDSSTSYGWAERNAREKALEERMAKAELKITADAIVSTVTGSDFGNLVTSAIEQTATGIHLKAKYVSWDSTYSSMTKDGYLTTKNGNVVNEFGDINTYSFTYDEEEISNITKNTYTGLGTSYLNNAVETSEFGVAPRDGILHLTNKGNTSVLKSVIAGSETSGNGLFYNTLFSSNGRFCANARYVNGSTVNTIFHCQYSTIPGGYRAVARLGDVRATADSTSSDGITFDLRRANDNGGGGLYISPYNFHIRSFNGDSDSSKTYTKLEMAYNNITMAINSSVYGFHSFIMNARSTSSAEAYIDGKAIQVASSGSSRRIKHDIKPFEESLNPQKLYDLRPKQFIYNDDVICQYDDMKGAVIPGFIAEEVEEIYPSAVIHDYDGKVKDWDERRIIPAMLALIQEQNERIKALENRFN